MGNYNRLFHYFLTFYRHNSPGATVVVTNKYITLCVPCSFLQMQFFPTFDETCEIIILKTLLETVEQAQWPMAAGAQTLQN